MTPKTSFGRRGRIAKIPAAPAASFEPALSRDQRELLFDGREAPSAEKAASSGEIAPWSGRAAFAAGFSVTGLVVAFTLVGGPREPVALAGSIFATGSNLAANLWLTQKFCAWARLSSPWAFAATGAALGAGAAVLYRLLAGRRPASPFA